MTVQRVIEYESFVFILTSIQFKIDESIINPLKIEYSIFPAIES